MAAPIERLARRFVARATLLSVGAMVCLPTGTAKDSLRILGIHFSPASEQIRVVVELSGPFRYRAGRLKKPDRLYLDFPGASLDPGFPGREIEVADASLARIRMHANDSSTRIVLDLGPDSRYTLEK